MDHVSIGAVVSRINCIVPIVVLLALSLTSTCNIYVHSVLALAVGSCRVAVVNVIVPGPDTLDRVYHEIPETSPFTVMSIPVVAFTLLSAGIVTIGAVLSILYVCTHVFTLPALSCTQAYMYHVPSAVNIGTVVDHPLQYSSN